MRRCVLQYRMKTTLHKYISIWHCRHAMPAARLCLSMVCLCFFSTKISFDRTQKSIDCDIFSSGTAFFLFFRLLFLRYNKIIMNWEGTCSFYRGCYPFRIFSIVFVKRLYKLTVNVIHSLKYLRVCCFVSLVFFLYCVRCCCCCLSLLLSFTSWRKWSECSIEYIERRSICLT